MRNTILILTATVLLASCGLARQKQATIKAIDNSVENLSTRQFGGIYTCGEQHSNEPNGFVYIYPETGTTALFYLFKSRGAPSYNIGDISGRITIQDGKATFRKHYGVLENACVLQFEFSNDTLIIKQDKEDCDCPFGYGVYIQDTFLRTTSKIPQYYLGSYNEKIYFSAWKEDDDE